MTEGGHDDGEEEDDVWVYHRGKEKMRMIPGYDMQNRRGYCWAVEKMSMVPGCMVKEEGDDGEDEDDTWVNHRGRKR